MPSTQPKPHRIDQLAAGVKRIYGCDATWIRTHPASKDWYGDFASDGVVQVYELSGHDRAERCYVWNYQQHGQWYYTTLLEIPPVSDPESAVKAGVTRRRKGIRRIS